MLERVQIKNYYLEEQKIFSALRKAGLAVSAVYDVGSSHGIWSSAVSRVFPSAEFFLFEPLFDFKPDYRKHYAKAINVRRNFHLFRIALGEEDGETKLFSDPVGYGASILLTQPSEYFPEEYVVALNRLDTIVAKHGLAAPEILKLDTQGAELQILQ